MGRVHLSAIALVCCIGASFALQYPAAARNACPTAPLLPPLHLPHLRAAVAQGEEALIVALGSSSTAGAMASTPAKSYPAKLQAELGVAWPDRHVAIINRGIGGQDAPRESARLEADVIAVRPQLVIWQVGANAALRSADLGAFRRLVGAGIERLQQAGIDVVLMDNQRSPRILASAENHELNETLAELAHETGANLFSRDRLMAEWEEDGTSLTAYIARDGLHQDDLGYACVAQALSQAIVAAVARPGLTAAR
jgi:acyl-CoA thioesterase I